MALLYIFKMPLIYVMLLAFILKGLEIEVYPPVMNSIRSMGNGFSSIGIITLEAQST